MKMLTVWQIALIPWYIFAAVWIITALRLRPVKTRERSLDRSLTLVVVVAAFSLLLAKWTSIGLLGIRFAPEETWLDWAGIALSFIGVALSVWARYCLGVYWSARVTLKEGHQLIRTGPYAYVRHPIYTGMLLTSLGTALVLGEWRGILAVVLIFLAHSRKALREQALLTSEFGEEYLSYCRRTGFLFPRLWLRGGMDTGATGS